MMRRFVRWANASSGGRWHILDVECDWGFRTLCDRSLRRERVTETRWYELADAPEEEPLDDDVCQFCRNRLLECEDYRSMGA